MPSPLSNSPRASARGRVVTLMLSGCLLAATTATMAGAAGRDLAKIKNWMVYYTDKAPVEAFNPYDLVVLDSRTHPPIQPLLQRGKIVLGYISLGEVEKFRRHYEAVKKEGLLLGRNPSWPDSRYVDLRDARWTRRVLEDLVPAILHKGFHGLFLDTLDNAAHLERQDPARFRGMTKAAAQLVRALRRHYPRIIIMMNRAYEILPEVAGDIDASLGESIYADYNFKTKQYGLVESGLYQRQVKWLKAARQRNPRLRIFTLDYWNPKDRATITRIYAVQRRNGFLPLVSVIGLDRIVPEPGR